MTEIVQQISYRVYNFDIMQFAELDAIFVYQTRPSTITVMTSLCAMTLIQSQILRLSIFLKSLGFKKIFFINTEVFMYLKKYMY